MTQHTRLSASEREELIEEHADLVRYEVERVAAGLPAQVDREDLLSAGMIGLIRAVDRYDPDRGASFTTYATSLMRGAILDELRRMDWAPRGLRSRYRRLEQALVDLRRRLGRQPAEQEIIDELGVSAEEYRSLLRDASTTAIVSLESLTEASGDAHAPSTASLPRASADWSPSAAIDRAELRRLLAECIEELSDRERLVLSLYYEQELTMQEIGMVVGVTESRICQIHTQVIARLRGALQARLGQASDLR
ncbi:MAG: FliA/WhiG family RNA polymerase sigma factor [Armatimonadota bacterium]|nr:FliA/WhiG family RNA polymerase sigma factor [Armatimonadota bacterium]